MSAIHWLEASGTLAVLTAMFVLAAIGVPRAQAQTAYSETVVQSFQAELPKGALPSSGLIMDSAGNVYGTASGGKRGVGVVYKLDTSGHETVLYNFVGGAAGDAPSAGVIFDSAGNLYGTTAAGGASRTGVVYKLNTSGQETVLYSFTAYRGNPSSGVIFDSAGNLYGTTSDEGGTLYKLDPAGQETVLYRFDCGGEGGCFPAGGVILDAAGNLYGTTSQGGSANEGVVYKVDPAGQETVLYSFTGGADGGGPFAGVILDAAGNLYGTTAFGGAAGYGVVYKVGTTGEETVLYSFTGGADGGTPYAGVILDAAGNLYGTAAQGGTANKGVVYKLDTAGQERVLYNFTGGVDGANPNAGVIRDSAGNLYGTTVYGGVANAGVVYELYTSGSLYSYSFKGDADGSEPIAGVIGDSAGNLYGTTVYGGAADAGVVYKLSAAGQETVLYTFTGGADGAFPQAGVIQDSSGNLYGTTSAGGAVGAVCGITYVSGCGVVFKVDPSGQETVLYTFTGGADGSNPYAGVIRDSAGNLYGTTEWGGASNAGVVYKLDTSGHETVLYSFTGGADGGYPAAGVILDSAGNLYGTTACGGTGNVGNPVCEDSGQGVGDGVVFKVNPSGQETVLHSFAGYPDGDGPTAGVIQDAAGNLYGTTQYGGSNSDGESGVVYKVDTAGQETVLYSFTGLADGGTPNAGVTLDSAGNLYGTTEIGGTAREGVVFMLNAAGQETVLFSFPGGAGGQDPVAGVILDSAGNLYGTTRSGGKSSPMGGVVYKLAPQ